MNLIVTYYLQMNVGMGNSDCVVTDVTQIQGPVAYPELLPKERLICKQPGLALEPRVSVL